MEKTDKLKVLLCPGYIRGVYVIGELLSGPLSEICSVVAALPDNRKRNGKFRFWQYLTEEEKDTAENMVIDPLERAGVPVCNALSKTDIAHNFVAEYKPDIGILANFGDIVPENIIEQFPLGIYNTHASDLPKYAGGTPYADAIDAGETHFWISLHEVDKGVDTGHVMMKIGPFPIYPGTKPMDLYPIGVWPTMFLIRSFLQEVYKSPDTFRDANKRRLFRRIIN